MRHPLAVPVILLLLITGGSWVTTGSTPESRVPPVPAISPAPPAGSRTGHRTHHAVRELGIQSLTPTPGETVGVGMPVILTFTWPVRNRAAVERSLDVRAARPVEGAWHWVSDTQVVYRTRTDWPAWQKVAVTAHLAGVRAAPGTYGAADRTLEFSVGRRQISLVNTLTHQMLVYQDGRLAQRMAISAGNASTREYTTTSGVHLTMDKGDPVRMVSPGRRQGDAGYYDVVIHHAVRISSSGEYVHAKDNLWAQGRVNVSHGCVNARPDQAAWFFDNSLRGDPVIVSGTDRPLEWWNGWGYWQLSWAEWLKGSALQDPGALALPYPEKSDYLGN
jgi:lipoprotein-anchoring transpeptidase ErfK/SrfK